jgi:hypothetical protein
VLLSGPAATFGLGVPSTDSVTSTVQSTVDTTQQTAATTVTQVENTVQTTVQSPTQAAAAPAPTAAAPAPVQTTAQKVAAAPKQTVSRATAPATKHAAGVAAPRSSGTQRVSSTRQGGSVASPVRSTVIRHSAARTHSPSHAATTKRSSGASTDGGPAQCDVSLLSLLPGGDQLAALVTLVCDTANGLDLPSRIGPAEQAASPTFATVLQALTSAPPARARARSAAPGTRHAAATESRTPAAAAAQAGRPGAATALPVGAATGVTGATSYTDSFKGPYASAPKAAAAAATDSATEHHHAWFSGTSRGTEVLMAILFASLAILGGIVLWRLAVRWVIPRFA